MKNAIIINGKTYQVRYLRYFPGGTNPCSDMCDLQKKCFKAQGCLCEAFYRNGFLSYFKKIEEKMQNSKDLGSP